MQKLKDITKLTNKDVAEFNKELRILINSDNEDLNKILDYIFREKGKQVRAHLVFLSSRLFGDVNRKTMLSAVLVQTLHTSTLLHDDVVDEAVLRRGIKTVNAEWKNKIAVLTGDYLFARALSIATENKIFDILHVLSPTISQLSIGEIIQLEVAGNREASEKVYYDIIKRKTAVLIGASAMSGAICGGANEEEQSKMREMGEEAGMAFQIQDDILDINANGLFGKAKGKDLEEKKYTLPLIHALSESPNDEANHYLNIIDKGVGKQEINKIKEFIEEKKGFDYAREKMQERINKSLDILKQMPNNEANKALREMIIYFTNRNK